MLPTTPSQRLQIDIAFMKKARDKCISLYNRTDREDIRAALQLATEAMTYTQFKLQAQLNLLTIDGKTNSN